MTSFPSSCRLFNVCLWCNDKSSWCWQEPVLLLKRSPCSEFLLKKESEKARTGLLFERLFPVFSLWEEVGKGVGKHKPLEESPPHVVSKELTSMKQWMTFVFFRSFTLTLLCFQISFRRWLLEKPLDNTCNWEGRNETFLLFDSSSSYKNVCFTTNKSVCAGKMLEILSSSSDSYFIPHFLSVSREEGRRFMTLVLQASLDIHPHSLSHFNHKRHKPMFS